MEGLRPTRIAFAPLIAATILAASAAPTAAAPVRAAAGGTQAVVDPFAGTAKITLPIDVRGPARLTDKQGRPTTLKALTSMWERVAEARWNAAFARMTYRPLCPGGIREPLRFKLDVQIHLFPLNAKSAHPGHHRITMMNKPGEGHVYRPKGSPPKPSDFGTVYDRPATGEWGRIDGNEATHEIAHLLGLSDDYKKVKGKPVPIKRDGMNRKGTLLADPKGRIDQQLIDRLGRLITQAKKLWTACIVTYDIDATARMTVAYDAPGDERKSAEVSWTGRWAEAKFRFFDLPRTLLITPFDPSKPIDGTTTVDYNFSVHSPTRGDCSGNMVGRSFPSVLLAKADLTSFDFMSQLAGVGEGWTSERNALYDTCPEDLRNSAHLIDSGYAFFDWDLQDAFGVTAMLDHGLLVGEAKLRDASLERPPLDSFSKGRSFTLSFDRSWVEGTEYETAILRIHFVNVPVRR